MDERGMYIFIKPGSGGGYAPERPFLSTPSSIFRRAGTPGEEEISLPEFLALAEKSAVFRQSVAR